MTAGTLRASGIPTALTPGGAQAVFRATLERERNSPHQRRGSIPAGETELIWPEFRAAAGRRRARFIMKVLPA